MCVVCPFALSLSLFLDFPWGGFSLLPIQSRSRSRSTGRKNKAAFAFDHLSLTVVYLIQGMKSITLPKVHVWSLLLSTRFRSYDHQANLLPVSQLDLWSLFRSFCYFTFAFPLFLLLHRGSARVRESEKERERRRERTRERWHLLARSQLDCLVYPVSLSLSFGPCPGRRKWHLQNGSNWCFSLCFSFAVFSSF